MMKIIFSDRITIETEKTRQATLRLVLQCKWRGTVMLRSDLSQGTPGFQKGTHPSRGMLGDIGSLLQGWRDPWGTKARDTSDNNSQNNMRDAQGDWRAVYAVLQGQRLVWWSNECDIDEGKACQGQLLLYGHAGTTQASPVISRELGLGLGMQLQGNNYDSRLVCVFGRDITGSPMRCTLLCTDSSNKESLSHEILNLLS